MMKGCPYIGWSGSFDATSMFYRMTDELGGRPYILSVLCCLCRKQVNGDLWRPWSCDPSIGLYCDGEQGDELINA